MNTPSRAEETRGGSPHGAIPQVAKLIWTVGFLLGAVSHAADVFTYGWMPYEFMPLGFNLYWTSLLFLDPIAALLIWWRPAPALVLGCLIMASDVLVNAWTAFVAGYTELLPSLALQCAFAAFVFYLAIRQKRSSQRHSDNP